MCWGGVGIGLVSIEFRSVSVGFGIISVRERKTVGGKKVNPGREAGIFCLNLNVANQPWMCSSASGSSWGKRSRFQGRFWW